jgi:aminoglycoside 3-N-acetyltransferase
MNDDEETIARRAWSAGLHAVGVRSGQVAVLGVDMGKLPLPRYPARLERDDIRRRSQLWCAFVLECLLEHLGANGTVVVPTFTYSCAAGGSYVHESTPSEVGPFSEYVRCLPGAHRSIHPLFSQAAFGRHAADIMDNVGKSAFGPASPYARLSRYDTIFLCLGASFGSSVTYLHHLEHCYGCNHRYHKVLESEVVCRGQRQLGPWLAYLRFRGTDATPDLTRAERRLRLEGVLREAEVGKGKFQAAYLPDVDRVCYAMLAEDPCAFVRRPVIYRLDERDIADEARTDAVLNFKQRSNLRYGIGRLADRLRCLRRLRRSLVIRQ